MDCQCIEAVRRGEIYPVHVHGYFRETTDTDPPGFKESAEYLYQLLDHISTMSKINGVGTETTYFEKMHYKLHSFDITRTEDLYLKFTLYGIKFNIDSLYNVLINLNDDDLGVANLMIDVTLYEEEQMKIREEGEEKEKEYHEENGEEENREYEHEYENELEYDWEGERDEYDVEEIELEVEEQQHPTEDKKNKEKAEGLNLEQEEEEEEDSEEEKGEKEMKEKRNELKEQEDMTPEKWEKDYVESEKINKDEDGQNKYCHKSKEMQEYESDEDEDEDENILLSGHIMSKYIENYIRFLVHLMDITEQGSNTVKRRNFLNFILNYLSELFLDQQIVCLYYYQIIFLRFFVILFRELKKYNQFDFLTSFCQCYHLIRPENIPKCSLIWFELITHKEFMDTLLKFSTDYKEWDLYSNLIVDLLNYLVKSYNINECENDWEKNFLFSRTTSFLNILIYNHPEFILKYRSKFLNLLPENWIGVRKMLLHEFQNSLKK